MTLDLIENDLFHIQVVAGNNANIFGVDISSSVHVDNKKKDILILGEGTTLDDTTLTAQKCIQ